MARKKITAQTHQQLVRQHLTAQRQSGLSVKAWCAQHDINYHTFYGWKKKDQAADLPELPGNHFIEVELPAPKVSSNTPFAELHLSENKVLRFFQPPEADYLARLLAAL